MSTLNCIVTCIFFPDKNIYNEVIAKEHLKVLAGEKVIKDGRQGLRPPERGLRQGPQ